MWKITICPAPSGKLSEVMESNSLLTAEVEKMNSTLIADHNTQKRTVIDIEKLGNSVVSLKGLFIFFKNIYFIHLNQEK